MQPDPRPAGAAVMVPVAAPAPAPGCNCAVCPFWIDNPAAIEPVCSGTNKDCAYCACVAVSCERCPIRCGSRTDIGAWMADVGGTLAFDDIDLVWSEVPDGLPAMVPQVDGHDTAAFDTDLSWPAYAVGLRRVFSPVTHTLMPKFGEVESARTALGLAADQLAVLVGYGEDPLVEAFWTRRAELIPELVAQRWDLILAPNFSMYGNQPRAEHLLNFRRNLQIAEELCDAGANAVPNIYWYRKEDLDRYLAWAADTAPAAVAINLQTFRTTTDWETMALPGLSYLGAGLAESCRVIVCGTSRTDRLDDLGRIFGTRLHCVIQNAQQYARHGAVMTPEGRQDVHAHLADAFAANVRHYDNLIHQARNNHE